MGNLRRRRSMEVAIKLRDKIISLIAGLPSRTAAKRGSTSTEIRKSGRQALSAAIAGVSRTRSPNERRRMISISEASGSPGSSEKAEPGLTDGTAARDRFGSTAEYGKLFGVDARFVSEHDGNIFANRINTAARRAFQA